MKKIPNLPEDTLAAPLEDFNSIAEKVFLSKAGEIYIGGIKTTPEMRGILREQAKFLATSQLWEIMQATIVQEAADLALRQSTDFEQVLSAKMLYHWGHVFINMVTILAKE